MRLFTLLLMAMLISACSNPYQNQALQGKVMPNLVGQTLEKQVVDIPAVFESPLTLLLIGYKQDTQFDIDRWLIGLDMTETKIDSYEIPAIQGMFPRMFKTQINNGMRAGIPKALWKGVITLYQDGQTMQQFTGNENANNARIMLINQQAEILYFYDRGFSVQALNELRTTLQANEHSQ